MPAQLADAQTCRVVAYHLISLKLLDEAVSLLEIVKDTLAPAEPNSCTDLAFARLHRLRLAAAAASPAVSPEYAAAEMAKVVDDLTTVIVGHWASRFSEIEWPCIILLSWAVAWAEWKWPGLQLWPEKALPADKFRLKSADGSGGPKLDVFVWLGWDTDRTDVDLHVAAPLAPTRAPPAVPSMRETLAAPAASLRSTPERAPPSPARWLTREL